MSSIFQQTFLATVIAEVEGRLEECRDRYLNLMEMVLRDSLRHLQHRSPSPENGLGVWDHYAKLSAFAQALIQQIVLEQNRMQNYRANRSNRRRRGKAVPPDWLEGFDKVSQRAKLRWAYRGQPLAYFSLSHGSLR